MHAEMNENSGLLRAQDTQQQYRNGSSARTFSASVSTSLKFDAKASLNMKPKGGSSILSVRDAYRACAQRFASETTPSV
jgi:hypothetical protein